VIAPSIFTSRLTNSDRSRFGNTKRTYFRPKKLSPATVSQYVSALRFLFVKTLRRHFLTEHIPFPKSPRRLPTVLSPEEVTRLINSAGNLFHRTLLMTLYSTAVRRSELCRLKVTDIDRQRMMIRILQGKGRHDRAVPLSPKLLATLRVYWRKSRRVGPCRRRQQWQKGWCTS
jgi:integrase